MALSGYTLVMMFIQKSHLNVLKVNFVACVVVLLDSKLFCQIFDIALVK